MNLTPPTPPDPEPDSAAFVPHSPETAACERDRCRRTRLRACGGLVVLVACLGWGILPRSPLAGRRAYAAPPAAPAKAAGAAKPADKPGDKAIAGLVLKLESIGPDASAPADTRTARLVSLRVPEGTPPSSFLPPGPFRATWEGDLAVSLRGDYAFSATGNGKLKVTLNDQSVLETAGDDLGAVQGKNVSLKKGKNHLVAVYESPTRGDGFVTLMWATDEFRPEPIPPTQFTHAASDALAAADQLREGRELMGALRCARCHAAPELAGAMKGDSTSADPHAAKVGNEKEAQALAKGVAPVRLDLRSLAMPELASDAPALSDVGARLNPAWMAYWISNPRALRPDASMPRLFHNAAKDGALKDGAAGGALAVEPQAADVAAYLASLGKGDEKPEAKPDDAAAAAGGRVLATLGCVVCHELPTKEAAAGPGASPEASPRVPLRYVKAKYKPAALEAFLRNPQAHYAWIRMPNFRLSESEAKALAAYLLANGKDLDRPAELAGASADKGKQLVESAGCLNCHAVGNSASTARAPALGAIAKDGWAKGCLAGDGAARGRAPDFGLSDRQRKALAAFAATDRASLKREALPEFAERQIRILRCTGCHTRDNNNEQWTDLSSETADLLPASAGGNEAGAAPDPNNPDAAANNATNAAPTAGGEEPIATGVEGGDQYRPPLTWTGEKLHPEWSASFIAGHLGYKPRTWIKARMPGFPSRAAPLAVGMALEHAAPPASPPPAAADAEMAKNGATLVGRNGGFSCISCHGVNQVPPIAAFEAPAINFMYAKERIRHEYFQRWMRNPSRVWPGTKMPQFADMDLKTTFRDIYEGDAVKQFEAVWNYLRAGRDVKHPEDEGTP